MRGNTQHTSNASEERSHLSDVVFEKLEAEHVTQTPRLVFTATELLMWALFILSILIGAIAFSLMIFFSVHAGYAFYEASHEGFLDFFLEVMPYAWVCVAIAMALLAHYNLRHTKHGYRYHVWQILLSSILLSFAGGVTLHMIGGSLIVDDFVAKRMPVLPAMHSIETRLWQSPFEGRMLGEFVPGSDELDHYMRFKDTAGSVWHLDIRELNPEDIDLLITGGRVRIVGVPSSTAESVFTGCGVFPWIIEEPRSWEDLRLQRDHFIQRMKAHHQKMLEALRASGTLPSVVLQNVCASNPAVRRITGG